MMKKSGNLWLLIEVCIAPLKRRVGFLAGCLEFDSNLTATVNLHKGDGKRCLTGDEFEEPCGIDRSGTGIGAHEAELRHGARDFEYFAHVAGHGTDTCGQFATVRRAGRPSCCNANAWRVN